MGAVAVARPRGGRGRRDGHRAGHRLPVEPAARPVLRARDDRVLAGAADRRQPLARLHGGLRGHSRAVPSRVLDARHRRQAHLGLDRPGAGGAGLARGPLPRAGASRLPAGRRPRGRGRRAVARRACALAEGRRDLHERGAHRRVRGPVGAVRRVRRSVLRVLGRSVGAVRAGGHHRRPRNRARAVPGRSGDHDRRDLAARPVRRHRRRDRRDLPGRLRLRADRDGAVRPAGPRRVDRRALATARRRADRAMSLLSVSRVSKRFGGIVANRSISFDVAPGELVGIIGPNGAGKSTLFEIITGFYPPDAGEVRLDGARLTGFAPDAVCRRGVARTFQKLRPFQGLTTLDNVVVGALTRTKDVRHARERARELLGRVGLAEKADAHARTLSTGQRKRLELARALATEPRVLLLDEVTGGVDQRTIPELVRLVRDLHAGGLTLLVIEHNMRVITAVAQRIVALHLGEVIADGPPDVVARDRRVVEAYLGQAYVP